MTRFYDIDDANAALPDLDGILTTLAEQRAELIRLRDQVTADEKPEPEELRRVRLRMQGLVDRRQVWLCWRRGEADVGHWHPVDTGFADRRPLSELV